MSDKQHAPPIHSPSTQLLNCCRAPSLPSYYGPRCYSLSSRCALSAANLLSESQMHSLAARLNEQRKQFQIINDTKRVYEPKGVVHSAKKRFIPHIVPPTYFEGRYSFEEPEPSPPSANNQQLSTSSQTQQLSTQSCLPSRFKRAWKSDRHASTSAFPCDASRALSSELALLDVHAAAQGGQHKTRKSPNSHNYENQWHIRLSMSERARREYDQNQREDHLRYEAQHRHHDDESNAMRSRWEEEEKKKIALLHPSSSSSHFASQPASAACSPSSSPVCSPPLSSLRVLSRSHRYALEQLYFKPLRAHLTHNLTPTWAVPHALQWKRHADTMTLDHASSSSVSTRALSPPPPPDSWRSHSQDAAQPQPHKHKAKRKQFQYDPVSEIHGFLSQKNIKELLKQTNYNRRELYVIYVRFKALCALSPTPEGINKDTFKKGVARLAVEDDKFVDRVFSLVDDDGSGQIEWQEFLTAMSALEKGSPEVKAKFFFQVYDLDSDGYISRSDLSTMFHSSSMLQDDQTTQEVVNTFVQKVFKQFNAEQSGKISLDDVLQFMKKNSSEDVWDVFGRSMLKDFNSRSK